MASWEPYWTEEVTIENGGRFPLLLNRFHDHLEDLLIKGIVSTIDRLRYVSYCCWIIGDIEKTLDCKNYNDFREAFIRRESALAIGTFINRPTTVLGNYTLYGERVMTIRVGKDSLTQDCSFSILPSSELGAFGQYYRGTFFNWGLIDTDESGVVHLTELGKRLFNIIDLYYVDNEYYKSFRGKKIVPTEVLKKWAKINEYDNIKSRKHKNEREFFKEILFHLDVIAVQDYRRDSLRIYLDCISECNKNGIQFDEAVLSNFLYFSKTKLPDSHRIIDVILSNNLDNALFIWKIYEIQAHFRWWISEYLRLFLRRLQSNISGMSLDEVINSIDAENFNQIIEKFTNLSDNFYRLTFDQIYLCIHQINRPNEYFFEANLREEKPMNLSQVAGVLVMALSLLYDKYLEIKNDLRYFGILEALSNDYWFNEFFQNIKQVKDYGISDFLKYVLHNYVIDKHDRAMYEKNDLRRCWFSKSADKYQYHADSSSIWRPAKHNNICNILYDMNLISVDDGSFVISDEGRDLINLLREKYYHEQ